MNIHTRFLIVVAVLTLVFPAASFAQTHVDGISVVSAEATSAPLRTGFLLRTRQPTNLATRPNPLLDRICEIAGTAQRVVDCAPTLTNFVPLRNFLPPPIISANLPHLRLDIVLTRMENQVVAGTGVAEDPANLLDLIFATFKITSNAADVSLPDPTSDGYGLPVPNPGQVWDDIPHANTIYQGIINNGCVNSPTIFDVHLESSIGKDSDILASVQLDDAVVGNGFYVFLYTIRAEDSEGNISDFIFSGDARAYCTAQQTL